VLVGTTKILGKRWESREVLYFFVVNLNPPICK